MINLNQKRLRWLSAFFFLIAVAVLQAQPTTWGNTDYKGEPWVKNESRPYPITKGLDGRHLAVWASHGIFYDLSQMKWRWQRPSLYCTTEDLFTQTIVVPYLIPMLEKAGANVFTPRERDWQRHEIIVDNDQTTAGSLINYREQSFKKRWMQAPAKGFALHAGNYQDGENPFEAGTARMAETTKSKSKHSYVTYQPTFPEEGRYAVYVSYQTVEASVPDAHYTVWHKGQKTDFRVNQQMGGSTWVYLGTFDFDAGSSKFNCVTIDNHSQHSGFVTTDAIRFGGGMGNIERGGKLSGMPRCLEGARYFAQWAGMPYSVYSSKNGENDYGDDINARSLMLNELCGGSVYAPDSAGRKVPIELSLAVHSDAGYNKPDGTGIYGSLSICTTEHGDSLLAAGHSRMMSHELATALLENTTEDLKHIYGTWVARELYDRNYSETRKPIVPSAILETLSHQNFGDMRFGQDPNFRFQMARSIYKTLLKYINGKHGHTYAVTPLPPRAFRIEFTDKAGEIRLSWAPTIDNQEPSATPTSYIIYTAQGQQDFDNGQVIVSNGALMKLRPGIVYSFRIAAVNDGGESFPTEVLSACYQPDAKQTVLVVSGFHRLSSPAICHQGFNLDEDMGVTYGRTCGWLGRQQVFDTELIGQVDEQGLGYSTDELAGMFIAGNDFNYVRSHADAIHAAGNYNIVSCSKEAIHRMQLFKYHVIDLILGLERNDRHSLVAYKTFPADLRSALSQYAAQGGRLLVSGCYVASDMMGNDDEVRFLNSVLKCRYVSTNNDTAERIHGLGMNFDIYRTLNEQHYAAQHTDVIMPSEKEAFPAMLYPDGTSAAVAYQGSDYRTFVMGFPFECIQQERPRNSIMRGILNFLTK